jgi:ppGpp synthetase/RelA/SpoT-type nucleotidyltranferase
LPRPENADEERRIGRASKFAVNLDEYERLLRPTYEAFANVVRLILEQAISAGSRVPRPQSVQARAKQIESLRRRLQESDKLDTQTLEIDRRDLAGARLVFYTNNDVDGFIASRLIRDNFDIEEDSTKVHHPLPENEGARYRAIHYTVRLKEDRLRLPEYVRFAGLRCEIQLQTILNHAWSETSHDIIYKDNLGTGFGQRALQGITRRFERIMDRYLIPAGYEIQKAQQDYERVLKGKAWFDQDIVQRLDQAHDNNERYEILSGLKDYTIPYYDDLPAAYSEFRPALLRAVQAARVTATVPIETSFGQMKGIQADMLTRLVVETIDSVRYADVIGTLQLLLDLYPNEADERIRKQIVTVAEHLAEFDINVYQKVGANLQLALLDYLGGLDVSGIDAAWDIALTVWRECLHSDITGSQWSADSVTLRTGAVPVSPLLKEIREKAFASLFNAYDRSMDESRRTAVFAALDAATSTPFQGNYSNDLLRLTVVDATRIVRFAIARASGMSYELRQHLEHQFHHDYQRARQLIDDPDNRFECVAEAQALATAILEFRDAINVDEDFARYKVLVGFESIYPGHWEEGREFDFREADQYRRAQASHYIRTIDSVNEAHWFRLIARCAETRSQDLMTFPLFVGFLTQLAEQRPEVADRLLGGASDGLREFLAAFLAGFERSTRTDIYEQTLERELQSGRNLAGLARHVRQSQGSHPGIASRLLARSIESATVTAVLECLIIAMERFGTDAITDSEAYLQQALGFLNGRQEVRWVQQAWFLRSTDPFYAGLSPAAVGLLFQNLNFLHRIDPHAERILEHLAAHCPEKVWDFFAARLAHDRRDDADNGPSYEAIPHRFFGLEKELSKDPDLAIRKGLAWFAERAELFQYGGGRLLSNTFPNCTPAFSEALLRVIQAGGELEASFALAILANYRGAPATQPVLREIVARFADDERKLKVVVNALNSTGVVSGEYGFANAWRERRQSLSEWLTDERLRVREFAKRHIAKLDLMIADEQRRAEGGRAMYEREFDEPDGAADDSERGDPGSR